MKRILAIAVLALALGGCAAGKQPPAFGEPTGHPDLTQTIEVACFTLKSAHVGFNLFTAIKPGVLSADEIRIEQVSYAGVVAFCEPPLDLANYQDVVNKLLFVAGAITHQLSQAQAAAP